MAYVVPQALVFQEIDIVAAPSVIQRRAHVAGGHAMLIRYAEDDEKVLGYLGQYESSFDTDYAWPERPAGAKVDQSYTKLFIDSALLRYYDKPLGAGDDTIEVPLTSAYNKIKSGSTVFKTNDEAAHDSVFLDRGVKAGDIAFITATVDSTDYELLTSVQGFEAEAVAAVIAEVNDDASNAAATVEAYEINQVSGTENCVDLVVDIGDSAYSGLTTGVEEETYTVVVTQGSTGGVASTAKLRVTSASGLDNDLDVTPADFGTSFPVGALGLEIQFTNDVSGDESLDSGIDLVEGQTWTVQATQTFTPVTFTSAGSSYTGTVDDIYIVEVTKGGSNADVAHAPEVSVRTSKGLDVSGPHVVRNVEISIGTKGVKIAPDPLTNNPLHKGDRFYITVTAARDGEIRTLILNHALPDAVVADTAEVGLALYIRKNLEVPQNRTDSAPLTNWDQVQAEFTVNAGMTAFDATWTDSGDLVALPVMTQGTYTKMYLEARYWLQTLAYEINFGNGNDGLELISGPLHPDNPLKYGYFKAMSNSNGTPVGFTAVCDPDDIDDWTRVLGLLEARRDMHGLVPLSKTTSVLSAYEAHVNNRSEPENARWRRAWFNAAGSSTKVLVDAATSTDEEVVLAVVMDNPAQSGTQYTRMHISSANADLIAAGVRPGDIVRYRFITDGFGEVTYDEYIIDDVVTADTLIVQTDIGQPSLVGEKMEIWRTLTTTELSQEVATSGGFSNRRISYVWPDEINADGYTVPGYFLCAALSGLASGVVPHQGLTRLGIAGFTATPRTNNLFSATQMDTMAAGGVHIVLEAEDSGAIYSRHAVTTGSTDDVAQREEMITRNFDDISYTFMNTYDPYIGISNVTDSAISALRAETRGTIKMLESTNFVERLGAQLILGELISMRRHVTLPDRLVIVIRLTVPAPLNVVEAHLQLIV